MPASLRRVVPALIVTSLSFGAFAASSDSTVSVAAPPATTESRIDHWSPDGPIVVGHRGASGYRPEHTLASYELAARMGADFIELDLVLTKDGQLVARHEPEISGTTDVAARPEFADRRRTVNLDGISVTGWWTHDLTLAELKTLRAVERLPAVRQENTMYNGLQRLHLRTPKGVPEQRGGRPFNDPTTYAPYLSPAGLAELSDFVEGIGPEKSMVIPRPADGTLGTPSSLLANIHAAGLVLHPYTFRAENQFRPTGYRVGTDLTAYGRAIDEQVTFLRGGVDGLFTDNPDVGVLARELALS